MGRRAEFVSLNKRRTIFWALVALQDKAEMPVPMSRRVVAENYSVGMERLALIEQEGIDAGWLEMYDEGRDAMKEDGNGKADGQSPGQAPG